MVNFDELANLKTPGTVPVRVPDDVAEDVKRWAQINGITPGELLQRAWDHWLHTHKDEILADLDKLRAKIEAA